jgi:N-acetylglucosamine-6-phosphate deacetylase
MSGSGRIIFTGMPIYFERKWVMDYAVVVEGKQFKAIIPANMVKHHLPAKKIEFGSDHRLIPGLIDLHVHGANGHDVMDGSVEALQGMSLALASEGVTGFLATTMTASPETLANVLPVIAEAKNQVEGAAILGVHLEGPFIAKEKMGAQDGRYTSLPDEALFAKWQNLSDDHIRVVTLAPELTGALSFIKMLRKNNVVASLGHTNASYDATMAAIQAGATQATHLFNAMQGVHQRDPGAAVALLLADEVTAEIIADGHHLHDAMLGLALRVKGFDRLLLVSDAMRAKCLNDGTYDLGGQSVIVKEGRATLADGRLAGSTLKLPKAIQRMAEGTRCSLADAVYMATYAPARVLQCETHKGSIEVGKDADLTILNANFDAVYTMREGKVCHRA